ncbi:MAG: endonuclease/exonuclease/phosphatase family protein [Planctomycetaceae bacterium]|nr:endonuclease/exonuclease/phosphatase family protein [Planctomycetaceae bacterium]
MKYTSPPGIVRTVRHSLRFCLPTDARRAFLALSVIVLMACRLHTCQPAFAGTDDIPSQTAGSIRIATFNVSMNRREDGQLKRDLAGDSEQIRSIATILRTVRPDIVLLNEFDQSNDPAAVELFQQRFLNSKGDDDSAGPIHYPHVYAAAVNTGQPSGLDLDQNGRFGDPGDNFGFGFFPGQYAMVVLSRFPIDKDGVRTFQKFRWKDLPNAAAPRGANGQLWYPPAVWEKLRLSSKSHWDVPIRVQGQTLHLLACHPTPPAFDGPEARNQRRNHDEIRLWHEYISSEDLPWLTDDQGRSGGLAAEAKFVIAGDLNADPSDGNSYESPAGLLLKHPRIVATPAPRSPGGRAASLEQGGVNKRHLGEAATDTADFSDSAVGNLRVDYVLPSTGFSIVKSGVVWPEPGEPLSTEVRASDHRLVWVNVQFAK